MLRKCYQNEEENHKKNNQTHPEREVEEREWERVRRESAETTNTLHRICLQIELFPVGSSGLRIAHSRLWWRGKYDYDKDKMYRKNWKPKILLIVNCKLPQMCRRSPREKMLDAGRITRVTNEMCCLKLPSVIRDFQHLFEVFKLINFLAKGRVGLRERGRERESVVEAGKGSERTWAACASNALNSFARLSLAFFHSLALSFPLSLSPSLYLSHFTAHCALILYSIVDMPDAWLSLT